jgi:hypothetical protein
LYYIIYIVVYYVHMRWKEFLMSIGLSAKQLWKAWEDHWLLFFAQPIAARAKGAHLDFTAGTKILVDQRRKSAATIKAGKPCQVQFDLRMLRMSQELHVLAGVRWWGTICRQRLVWTPSSSLGRVDEKCLMFVQSNTNIDWKLVDIYWHASSKTLWESLRHGLNFESKLKRTIADCPEVLEVFSVETLKEKASMQMESSLLCLVVYWLFHRIWQDSRTHNGKSCSLTKGLATSSRSGFWRLKWALTMICQRSSQHIPRSDRHMFRF